MGTVVSMTVNSLTVAVTAASYFPLMHQLALHFGMDSRKRSSAKHHTPTHHILRPLSGDGLLYLYSSEHQSTTYPTRRKTLVRQHNKRAKSVTNLLAKHRTILADETTGT
jgi:hypothetical protein